MARNNFSKTHKFQPNAIPPERVRLASLSALHEFSSSAAPHPTDHRQTPESVLHRSRQVVAFACVCQRQQQQQQLAERASENEFLRSRCGWNETECHYSCSFAILCRRVRHRRRAGCWSSSSSASTGVGSSSRKLGRNMTMATRVRG